MEMQNQKRGRSAGIELFRVVLMFGICLLHSIGQNGCPGSWLTYLLRPCVVAFVFISVRNLFDYRCRTARRICCRKKPSGEVVPTN